MPSFFAADRRAWPAMMTPSLSTRIGLVKPNALMLSATWLICRSLCVLEFFSYAISLLVGHTAITKWDRSIMRRPHSLGG